MQLQVAPSILSSDFANLGRDIRMLNKAADIIHLDVMDGTFVPNISFGFPVIEAVAKIARIPMDAHLMVVNPHKWFERCAKLGVQMCSFHLEAVGARKAASNLKAIRALGMKAGLVVNPDIPVEKLYPFIGKADFFLIMSVFAGFGGQKFIYESLDKVAALKAEIDARGDSAPIEVDGGVSASNAGALREAGASILVAGSAVFKAEDPAAAIEAIRNAR
ncbi:MAG: ribulose-phosphate 3-epimerase [Bacteroidales bacterium]|nr:ribulose-phosphate 3-epimerase [Bacteroidales bacterium]